jgi:hypothetical protein
MLMVALVCVVAPGCKPDATSDHRSETPRAKQAGDQEHDRAPWFTDVAEQTGLRFMHTTGATGDFHFPEIAASGCALFDFDNDGDLDAYLIQCHPLSPDAPRAADDGMNRLFRNDLESAPDGTTRLRFVDVTASAGVGDRGYGMGCAVGDYDNDGNIDLYVTNFGPNVLFRNNGDGTFSRQDESLPPTPTWSASAAFLDYDNDGRLDLFVADYVDFTVAENNICHSRSSRRDYCGPNSYNPIPDHLFHNNGDGTFSEVTRDAGIHRAYGSGLGVVSADFNDDHRPDIYVANDGNANQLWINRGDGTFENTALISGTAYNGEGMPEAGMGVTAGDFDMDGDEDIFLAHLVGEHNTLLVNDGRGLFEDRTDAFGLGAPSRPVTAFGVEWFDVDLDGDLDAFLANGAVKIADEYATLDYPYPYPNQLFVNSGPPDFRFRDASAEAGPDVEALHVSRGAAFGDIDNDGDIDILVSNSNGPAQLLINNTKRQGNFLRLRVVGVQSNRSAIGAVVRLERDGMPPLIRRVHADGSYCSANDLRVVFALGDDAAPQEALVVYPGGKAARFTGLEVNREHVLFENDGPPRP